MNYNTPPKPKEVDGAEVTGKGDQFRVTVGKQVEPDWVRSQHGGIRIIDHAGSSGDSGGGFLKKRFNR